MFGPGGYSSNFLLSGADVGQPITGLVLELWLDGEVV